MTDQTVFVIDDDQAVRESIAALVEIRGLPVRTFASAEQFLKFYDSPHPGCVVTDLRIDPGMSGIDLQVKLQGRGFDIPVIVISAYANVSNAVQAMHHGAVTLLEKNCSTEELWQAITEALRVDQENRASQDATHDLLERFRTLTADEAKVMVRIIQGTLNKNIAKELSLSLRTVETRRHNVLSKVGVSSVPELVRLYVELEKTMGRPPEELISE
jgi:two-component system, LuxR family, response regulator FixJ